MPLAVVLSMLSIACSQVYFSVILALSDFAEGDEQHGLNLIVDIANAK